MKALETFTVPALPGLTRRESQEAGVLAELASIAHKNGWDPVALALVIESESGWDPKAQGPGTVQAQGLNQISKANRRAFKLPSDVRNWSAKKQLRRIVEPYFQRVLGTAKPAEPWQYYAANFIGNWNGARGEPLRDGRGELVPGNPSYDGNRKALDPKGDGYIGPEHLAAALEARSASARGQTLMVRMQRSSGGAWKFLFGVGLAAGAVAGIRWAARRLEA